MMALEPPSLGQELGQECHDVLGEAFLYPFPSPLSFSSQETFSTSPARNYLVLFQLFKEAGWPFSVSIPESPKGAFDVTCLG